MVSHTKSVRKTGGITKINEFCAKYNCRWMPLIVNGRYCLTIIKK